jgi:hypothetical protein
MYVYHVAGGYEQQLLWCVFMLIVNVFQLHFCINFRLNSIPRTTYLLFFVALPDALQMSGRCAVLQACLRRHLTQRCEDACADPAHAGFVTYTPRKVPCYLALLRRHARAPAAPRVPGGPTRVLLARIYQSFRHSVIPAMLYTCAVVCLTLV